LTDDRAFPVVYAHDVSVTAAFYERLGFERHYQLPAEGEPGYVGLRRGSSELGVVASTWPREQYGAEMGAGVASSSSCTSPMSMRSSASCVRTSP
jgi:hypothetical protein